MEKQSAILKRINVTKGKVREDVMEKQNACLLSRFTVVKRRNGANSKWFHKKLRMNYLVHERKTWHAG